MRELTPSDKAVANERGFLFDPDSGMATIINKARRYRAVGLTCCIVYSPEGQPLEYVLFKDGEPIYHHTSIESICVQADVHAYLAKQVPARKNGRASGKRRREKGMLE
ncbi:hypothetical protein [Zavarzinella formosa]|uniref:hypothetical protein n=1 Tax=Zavarzinella formosa TaxID=360055 RepID=UPI000380BC3D|nr:hypothetical protein [Zavarzinella formosa]